MSRADELNPVFWTVTHGYLVDQRNAADIIRALETEHDQLKRELDEARRELAEIMVFPLRGPGGRTCTDDHGLTVVCIRKPEGIVTCSGNITVIKRLWCNERWGPGTGDELFPE